MRLRLRRRKSATASRVVAAAKGDGMARSSYGSKRVRQQQDGSGRENNEGRRGWQRRVPLLLEMLVARREGTVAVGSDEEVEANGDRWLGAEGSSRQSRLCVGGQWQGGRGSGTSNKGCSRGGRLLATDGVTVDVTG
ncbi:hypothetical protein BHM03_00008009 [Ensete ventricosum]|nr:hypothetical protein BHM03_00008009 [Ensete ventricosum]